MRFKQYHLLESEMLEEGSYLAVVKHFTNIAVKLRSIRQAEMAETALLKKHNVFRKEDFISSTDISDLAEETRALINNFPEQHRPTLTGLVEKISGECLDAFGEHIVVRMYEAKNYKNFFKLYVLNFFLETLVMHSITDENDFEKIMTSLHRIFANINEISGSATQQLTKMIALPFAIVSTVGKLIKTLANQM
jgi:hypothetical protein